MGIKLKQYLNKPWLQVLLLAMLDFIIIWCWVRQEDPDPSVTIGLIILIPLVIVINLILAFIMFFYQLRYSKAFLINTVIAAFIMNSLYVAGIQRHQRARYESWRFIIRDTTFRIIHSKTDSRFSISYSTSPGSSNSYTEGRFTSKAAVYLLTTDSSTFEIKDNFLLGFRGSDSIQLKKDND